MNLVAFQQLRSGLTRNGRPASARTLSFFESSLFRALADSEMFSAVEVEAGEDRDRLLLALCTIRRGCEEDEVVAVLERVWASMGHAYWEAHAFLTEQGHVELQAGTLGGAGGEYVTVHLVAQAAAQVPARRKGAAHLVAV